MDILEELLQAILNLFILIIRLVNLAIHAVLAIFIPANRAPLKQRWESSGAQRIEIIFGFFLLILLISLALFVTSKFSSCSSHRFAHQYSTSETTKESNTVGIKFSKDEENSMQIEVSDELKDSLKEKATHFLKEKWENR